MMVHFRRLASFFVIASILEIGCKDENPTNPTKPPLQVPSSYDSTGYSASVITESAVRSQLSSLVSAMQVARNMDSSVLNSDLQTLYNGTTLRAVTNASYQAKIDSLFPILSSASGIGVRYAWENAPIGTGGVVPSANGGRTGYLFDRNMLEPEQIVEKGLFAAAMYNHAISIINTAPLNGSSIDKLVEIFGAKPGFKNNERSSDPQRDRFSAQYAARRSDSTNANSLYAQIKRHLIQAKAAIAAGSEYNIERDEALQAFKLTWEKILMATVVNYCHSTFGLLSTGTRDDATISSAMHAYGECVGFLSGWKGVPSSQRKITDAELDELLQLLRSPYTATINAESYLFLSSNSELSQLYRLDGRNNPNVGVIERIQSIYSFTNLEIEEFRLNWVNTQNRR